MDFKENKAIYLQIADLICENILTGKWKEEERIPAVREIAVDIEVNPNTVVRAYNFLQDKNIIYNKRGIGYFVSTSGYDTTLTLKKDEFIHEDLKIMFKKMKILKISFDQLSSFYNNTNSEI